MAFNKILCVVLLLKCVHSVEWHEPAFFPNEGEHRVKFGENIGSYIIIYLEENIQEPIVVAFLNYKGKEMPQISKFYEPSSSSNIMLGASFNQPNEDSFWELIVIIPQDYDDKFDGFRYAFEITAGNVARKVFLYLINIDDEPPIIKVLQNPCQIEENYIGPSNCIYNITDVDGVMGGTVKYTLSGMDGIDTTFTFKNDELQNGLKQWDTVLNVLTPLNYESVPMYAFEFTVEDSGGNRDKATIVVQVLDQADQPPVWTNIFSFKHILEKQEQIFQVEAVDGDWAVNAEINYLMYTEWPHLFSINSKTGVITISPIDRDFLQQNTFTFELVAYEAQDPNSSIGQQVMILVEDINDHLPEITIDKNNVTIPENSVTTLDINIEINDRDWGEHAIYEVSLGDNVYSKAFQICPNRGYQKGMFSISVVDTALLDYEDITWQEITLEIKAKEISHPTHENLKTIRIFLENWNDEIPIFSENEYIATVPENIPKDRVFNQVTATDRDVGDIIRYSLIGRAANDKFIIDEAGFVKTKIDNAFDYKQESLVTIIVQAEDSLGDIHHKTFTQILVHVQDVNDDSPEISVPSRPITIEENQLHGTIVNADIPITATDESLSAELEFWIDWNESYALKNGQVVPIEHYEGCLDVTTQVDTKNQRANAVLSVHEIMLDNTPDYELFDVLYLTLFVEDVNQIQQLNTDSGVVVINIIDRNDNAPVFASETINSPKYVVEHAAEGTLIATIIATDADGPDFNLITYSLWPVSTTPKNWIAIDAHTGNLYVSATGEIDADLPIYSLEYVVAASDGHHLTEALIIIHVTDINDNYPEVDGLSAKVMINEKSANNTVVQIILATDHDRDEQHNTPWFKLSEYVSEEVKKFFSIDTFTGKVYVDYKTNEMLDRDRGSTQFIIVFIVGDNYDSVGASKQQNIREHSFIIKLADINDNAPVIQTRSLDTTENLLKDEIVGIVEAIDHDEPKTDNTKIHFTILNIEKGDGATADPPADLFYINPDADPYSGKATLIAGYDLMGYYGTYHVAIQTNDFGEPMQFYASTVDIIVQHNSKPQFLFPIGGELIYLSKEQTLNQPLVIYDGSFLENIKTTDCQNEACDVEFNIDPASNPNNMFLIVPSGKSQGQLQLNSHPDYDSIYQLQIIAKCNCICANSPTTSVTIEIQFKDGSPEPIFDVNTVLRQFTENLTGIGTVQQLPKAHYITAGSDEYPIYYFIVDDTCWGCFEINKATAELTLTKMLDRENQDFHNVTVVASKSPTGSLDPIEPSKLTVLIEVNDVNDNPPHFEKDTYYAGVSPSDDLYKTIQQIRATDLDKDDSLLYLMRSESLSSHGDGIGDIKHPFIIDSKTGNVHLNFTVKPTMTGYFMFLAEVQDEASHIDIALIMVYILPEGKQSILNFKNDVATVTHKQRYILSILEHKFGYKCNAEVIEETASKEEESTCITIYCFNPDTKELIDSNTIQQILNNAIGFTSLKLEFLEAGLNFLNFDSRVHK